MTWIAQIKAEGQVFERRVEGEVHKRESLRRQAADAVVRDYLDWIERIGG